MSTFFIFSLDGAQAGTASTATGVGFGIFDQTLGSLIYSLTISGLDFGTLSTAFPARETIDTADDVTVAHTHIAAAGQNGGVAYSFFQ